MAPAGGAGPSGEHRREFARRILPFCWLLRGCGLLRRGQRRHYPRRDWDGTAWRAQPTPAVAPGLHVYLSGVSCASGRDCEAVGERAGATKGSLLPLLEEWNGRSWEVQPSPVVPKADGYASLSAVSCASPRACEAVGFDEATDGFAEVWDGRSWKLQPVPQPSGKGSLGYLYSVSCASPGTCVAVGFAYTAAPVTHALVVAWDGAHWENQAVPTIAGDSDVALFGVSCPSASDCEAVGSYSDGTHGQHTLAEAWTGSAWRTQLTPGGIGKP